MIDLQKNEIVTFIEREKATLGSYAAVANKAGASEATLSHMRSRNWSKIAPSMWRKVGAALGWKANGWQIVMTDNTNLLFGVFESARRQTMWIPVANPAGSGKSVSAKAYTRTHGKSGVYFFQAREYTRRMFLRELAASLGIKVTTKDHTEEMVVAITQFFRDRADQNPLLIIDEADKLHPGAIRALIPLYNELEDELAVVIIGTENLKRQFDNGTQWGKKGYDELSSRFGRKFVTLPGISMNDVFSICKANGLDDQKAVLRVWNGLEKVQRSEDGQTVKLVTDLRRVRRLVRAELLVQDTPTQA